MPNEIFIKGARTNNLKNIDVKIPRDKLTVITGLSGSGKSSLAFDTIYAEGHRRYVESLSVYARQFLGQLEKPDVDYIDGLSPAISIDQKTANRNPRSTVGTVTEIYDYLRLLYAHIGVAHCYVCGKEIKRQSVDQIVDDIFDMATGDKIQILSPVVREQKGAHVKVFEQAASDGFVRVRVDKTVFELSDPFPALSKSKKHDIEIVVDRLVIKEGIKRRLTDSVETAGKISGGLVLVDIVGKQEALFSQNYACHDCGVNLEEITPRMFSFNNPLGACPVCSGLGYVMKIDRDKLFSDKDASLMFNLEISLNFLGAGSGINALTRFYEALARHYKFKPRTAVKDLPDGIIDIILYGTNNAVNTSLGVRKRNTFPVNFDGLMSKFEERYNSTNSNWLKTQIGHMLLRTSCDACKGARLKKESLAVKVADINISELCSLSIEQTLEFFNELQLSAKHQIVAKQILKEIQSRLEFLNSVGLSYITLSRAAATLSGGEAQRIRLATQIGSGLMGVLYVLDEPSIGLHQRDNGRLIAALKRLRDLGNTLIVVEHDEETMYAADYIVDIGPLAGVHGGHLVVQGDLDKVKKCNDSITGQYLSGFKKIETPSRRNKGNGKFMKITGAAQNNLKEIDVSIPLGAMICVTGVSGSGKSSLVNDVIYKGLSNILNKSKKAIVNYKKMSGVSSLSKVINVDQSPIGRTPRSNPATYMGIFTDVRTLFAKTNEAKSKGYEAGRFSFNVAGGRCEICNGDGIIKVEMHFLPDVYVTCDACRGMRYNRETLEVKYKGMSIYDVLNMTSDEGLDFFSNIPRISRALQTLVDVGLGYIKIGQSSTTLSGGEAQRVKLAAELCRSSQGATMYILDEPTTGLHMADVHRLIDVLQKLVSAGNTVVVIEHNFDVIKCADYVVDLGPEGGDKGGNIVAFGTPEQVALCAGSYTGEYLKKILNI